MTTQTLRTTGISASRDYQDLPAWTKAVAVAERIYALTENFPSREHNGLSSQLRMSAVNIASNIASASSKNNEHGITDSYSRAQGAIAEVMTQLTIAARLGYTEEETATEVNEAMDEVSRLLTGMKHGLKVAAKDADRAEKAAAKLDREASERAERPRREYKPRDRDGEERPRREYKSRDAGEDRPRREYKPRDGEDRPRREYKPRDRDGEDRPRREYKPREDRGERKPYGDKKPYGKKPYGEKKPYGDKKPYGGGKSGGKPFRKPRDRD